jgi:nucleoside-diphosphate-sugar epimerase
MEVAGRLTKSTLVTGGRGFVGSGLCSSLRDHGWRVVAGSREHVPAADGTNMGSACLPLSTNPGRWQEALKSIDCVVHLAAHVHRMGRDRVPDSDYEIINVEGSRFVAEQSALAGVKRFVFLSSAKVNGEGRSSLPYRAEDPAEPQDAYGRSKLAAEGVIADICGRNGMDLIIIRPPLVYGPGVRANFHRLLRVVELGMPLPLASIHNRRSLIGVANLVDFIETCMTHPLASGRVWLVADGEDLSTPDLLRRLADIMNKPSRLFSCPPSVLKAAANLIGRGEEAARLCDSFMLDTQPAQDILGWRAPIRVDEGLRRTVAEYMTRRKE